MRNNHETAFASMIRLLSTVLVCALALIVPGCVGGEAVSADAPSLLTAVIDKECLSQPASLTVPEGKSASSFKLLGFQEGTACHEGGAPENKGYAIRDGKNNPAYMWSQYRDQKPYERGGPLESLVLKPGEYALSVAGGAGARVELSYELK